MYSVVAESEPEKVVHSKEKYLNNHYIERKGKGGMEGLVVLKQTNEQGAVWSDLTIKIF